LLPPLPPVAVRVGGAIKEPKKLKDARPEYPAIAQQAMRQWEYTPTLLNGVPVSVIMTVTVNFSLS
jgi:protein TonB